jgi:hypothetical protein
VKHDLPVHTVAILLHPGADGPELEIRCQSFILAQKDEPTPDYAQKDEPTPDYARLGSPKGRPRLTRQRDVATSASVCGWLTICRTKAAIQT